MSARWALVAAAVFVVAPLQLFGEKIGLRAGFGYDGALFGPMAHDPVEALRAISLYRLQRWLPPALVHYGHLALGLPISDASIVRGFAVLNAASVAVAAWGFGEVAALLGLSARATVLGGIGLLANFATLKMLSYNPVLVDAMGMALGVLALHAWLLGRPLRLLALTVVSAFVWSTAWYFCLPLLAWPARRHGVTAATSRDLATALAGLATVAALAVASLDHIPPLTASAPFPALWLALSAALAAAWVFLGSRPLAEAIPWGRLGETLFQGGNGLVLAAVAVALIQAVWRLVPSAPSEYPMSLSVQAPALAARALDAPGIHALCHVSYLGPIVVLSIRRWRSLVSLAASYGPGLPLFLGLLVGTTLDSQSRHHVFVFPALVALTARLLDGEALTAGRLAAFALLSLLVSRAFLPIGPLAGPRYWENFGPWWTWSEYWTKLGIAAFAAAVTLALFRARRP